MCRNLDYRVWDNEKKEYSDKPFSLDQYGILYVQDEDGYWEEASDRYVLEFSTGLKDMNGKMIREGDIVDVHNNDMLHDHNKFFGDKALVKCSLSKGGAFIIRNWYGERILNYDIHLRFVEVIGNIHENEELLGGKE